MAATIHTTVQRNDHGGTVLVGFRDYDDGLGMYQFFNRYLRQLDVLPDIDEGGLGLSSGTFVEEDGDLVLRLEMPGVRTEELEVSAHGSTISIRAQHDEDVPEGYRALRRERPGSWQMTRTYTIPTVADAESVQARLNDGLLTVRMKQKQKPIPRHIAIETREG